MRTDKRPDRRVSTLAASSSADTRIVPRGRTQRGAFDEWPRLGERGMGFWIAVLVAAVFASAVGGGFVNLDDPQYLFDNTLVPAGLTFETLRGAFTTSVFHQWAPLTILSLALDTSLFGTAPWGYHLTSVLIHAATAGVLFLALARMTGATGRSAAAAILFALHPLRVESVAWIAERKDVLSVFFVALALLTYERYCRRPSWVRYGAVVAAMIASLMAKATAVTLPALLLVLDIWPLRRVDVPWLGTASRDDRLGAASGAARWRTILVEKLPLLIVSAVFTLFTLATNTSAMQREEAYPLLSIRVPHAIMATAAYLRETFVPIGLHPAHEHSGVAVPMDRLLVASLVLGLTCGLAAVLRRAVPACAAGLAWFFIALTPVAGIVTQLGFASRADRFTYLPHIGLMIAIVWTFASFLERQRLGRWAGMALVAAAVVACILLDRRQIAVWNDSVVLWKHVVAVEPGSPAGRVCLGMALADRGDTDAAIAEFRTALVIKDEARTHYRLGMVLAERGESAEAYGELAAATERDPQLWRAHLNAGIMLARMNHLTEALERMERAAAIAPSHPEVTDNIDRVREAMAQRPSP